MAHNTISEIERGARRVDVDDLMALAVALGVAPATLLMPDSVGRLDHVESTGVADPVPAEDLWAWLTAEYPLVRTPPLSFAERSWPSWVQESYIDRLTKQTVEAAAVLKALSGGVGGEPGEYRGIPRALFSALSELMDGGEVSSGDD